ncbi:MAG: hypothetical protein GX606_05195 [Elusimicrobia bacterium]|nr:hypothetical protein [Elusimicrobiota bacterium]
MMDRERKEQRRQENPSHGSRRAQAVMEVAIFGSVLVFLIAAILSSGTSAAFQQRAQLSLLSEALRKSQSSQSNVSIMVVEDRLSPGAAKYGPSDRAMYVASASATLHNQLFYTADAGEFSGPCGSRGNKTPYMYVRINGQEKCLTTARFLTQSCSRFCTIEPATSSSGRNTASCSSQCFPPGNPTWCYSCKSAGAVQSELDEGASSVSYDVNGDYVEELVFSINGGSCQTLDYTKGDYNSADPTQGLQPDMEITTRQEASLETGPEHGQGGAWLGGRFVKNQTDVITRKFKGNYQTFSFTSTVGYNPGWSLKRWQAKTAE